MESSNNSQERTKTAAPTIPLSNRMTATTCPSLPHNLIAAASVSAVRGQNAVFRRPDKVSREPRQIAVSAAPGLHRHTFEPGAEPVSPVPSRPLALENLSLRARPARRASLPTVAAIQVWDGKTRLKRSGQKTGPTLNFFMPVPTRQLHMITKSTKCAFVSSCASDP